MKDYLLAGTTIETKVNYPIEFKDNFVIVENLPARVCLETGERFFSPETVERLQQIIWAEGQPSRTIETPVFEF